MGFLSFEFVSYFDIRILNLVAAKGRAKPFVVKLFSVAALLCYGNNSDFWRNGKSGAHSP
ncbi:MAG: hypothetical protein CV080_01485 [Candidatus Kuenenia stuttgartiensis]|nr:MAG: hypothetical protein CV080_01485 [Candidatus Kuenenia stuttgartiensis]